jgi:hypothetical protein
MKEAEGVPIRMVIFLFAVAGAVKRIGQSYLLGWPRRRGRDGEEERKGGGAAQLWIEIDELRPTMAGVLKLAVPPAPSAWSRLKFTVASACTRSIPS